MFCCSVFDVDVEWDLELGVDGIVPDVHTSSIYVEKSAEYKMVITALAKKVRTGNID